MSIKYSDSGFLDGADETKKLSFDVSGVTTGTTRTITMPDGDTKLYTGDGTSGQILTSGGAGVAPTFQAAAGGGKVLQVVSFTSSTQGSTSITTSDTASNPVIQDTITPLGNSSKFLIQVRWFGEVGDAWGCVAHIHRGSSRINEANTNNYHGLSMPTQSHPAGENNDSTPEILTLSTLDTTGSTTGTSITFKLMFSHQSTRTMWTNRCFGTGASSETGVSEMIITEIGA